MGFHSRTAEGRGSSAPHAVMGTIKIYDCTAPVGIFLIPCMDTQIWRNTFHKDPKHDLQKISNMISWLWPCNVTLKTW